MKGRAYDIYKNMFSYWCSLVLFIFIISHICLCTRAFIIKETIGSQEMYYEHFESRDLRFLYVNGFYYAVVSLVGVGYGDILPKNNQEIYFIAVFMVSLF